MKYTYRLNLPLLLLGLTFICRSEVYAQSQNEAAVLRGEGAFLRGLGSYNLNTARADSINLNTMIRWKQDLRNDLKLYREKREQDEAKKKQRHADVRKQQELRERQLRLNPSASDIQNGQALNALFFDLVDPDFKSEQWSYRQILLPKGLSVKDLIFTFTPMSNSSLASKALSRGVVALSRLEVEGDKWSTVLKQNELARERREYEIAYTRLRDNLINNQSINTEIEALDAAIKSLKRKVDSVVPEARGFRSQGQKYLKELYEATRMFDAETVDYSRDILVETKDHETTTVSELIGFMLKYRLQFASVENIPQGRELYRVVYDLLHKQMEALTGPTQPRESEIDKIIREHGIAYYSAADKLISAFDRQARELQESPTLKPEERDLNAQILQMERVHFEGTGTIPFSPMMRNDVIEYLAELKRADEASSRAIASLKQNDKVADKKKLIEPSVVGKWDFVSQVDRNFRFTWTLFSNGSIDQGSSRWTLNPSNLVLTHPNNKAPGGAWVDTCMIEDNGQQLTAKNQLGHAFKATRVD